MNLSQKKVIIIGGGITGLAAAYTLQELARKNQAPVSFTLLEGQPRLGGKILTDTDTGFVIEGGPDSFISQKPWALELCRQLGLKDRLTGTNREQTATYILHHGRLVNLPEGVMLLVPTRLGPFIKTPLFSPLGKLRMGLDWIIPKKQTAEDESLAGFVRRRLGQEAVERLAEPLLAGIYAGDAEQMSLAATFPQFMELEQRYGSLIRGMLARRREMRERTPSGTGTSPGTIPTTMFMTLKGGLSELVAALVSKLDRNSLMIGAEVERIHWKSGLSTYHVRLKDGTALTADAVIAASPAYVTADLLAETDATLVRMLREVPYVSTATVSLAYQKAGFRHPLNGFGFVVPRREDRSIMACTWTSTKFPHRAPGDQVLLRCFVGGAGREEVVGLSEKDLVNRVRDDLRAIMGITEDPVLSRVYRWEKANPQYPVGHLDRLAGIDDRLTRLPGLFLAGAAYRGVGVPDCIRQGNEAAERAFKYLTVK
ncbi:MAG: protoporphyrinogen oxidase [Nitrospirae bacterium]|nr:protoporphyrinogen oxidase [Nitrospirota bacterium]